MAHLHRVVSTVTQHRVPGLPQPGTTKANTPNPLDTSLARRERCFRMRSPWDHLVSCDVLFSSPKFCFFMQLQNSKRDGHRVCHHPPLMTRRYSSSNRWVDCQVSRWESIAITVYICILMNCTHLHSIWIYQQFKNTPRPSNKQMTQQSIGGKRIK